MSNEEYKYYSKSPEEWEKLDSQNNPKKPKKKGSKAGIILGINVAAIIVILLVYFQFNGNPTIKNKSLQNVGDFQVYISASKDKFLSGSPLDFMVYLTNMSGVQKKFTISAFSVKISSESTVVYTFNISKVIESDASPKSSILLYDLKHEVNLSDMKAGIYKANILMNLNGKVVALEKDFTYISTLEAILNSGDDFFTEDEKGDFTLYVKNNTLSPLNLNVQKIDFSIFDRGMHELYSQSVALNSQFSIMTNEEAFIYEYKTNPINKPGDYYLISHIVGNETLAATCAFSVVNKNAINGISNIKLISDIPLYVNANIPIDFSVSLVNNDIFQKKYAVLNSLTILIKKGNIELYRFSDQKSHNFEIPPGGTRLLIDSNNWHQLTFPSTGTYTFEVIVKIGDEFIKYVKQIESS